MVTECPDCASANIIQSKATDQTICRDCGLIFEPFTAAGFTPEATITKTVAPEMAPKKKPTKKKSRK